MKKITIREVEEKDLSTIKMLINDVWRWDDLVSDKKTLDATIGLYLNQVLFGSTFGKVAILNNEVIGVIFGYCDEEIPKFRIMLDDATEHAITLLGAPYEEQQAVYKVLSGLNLAYENLISDKEDDYDGILDFFLVSPKAQGLGVGKQLWQELKNYFVEKDAKYIYVYTDTDCNYGFYEHAGFKRVASQELTCDFGTSTWTVNILLYDYKII